MKLLKSKNWIWSVGILTLIFSCTKNDDEQNSNGNNQNDIKVKDISVSIELPNGTSFSANTLKVSTILTEESPVTEGTSKVTTFDDHATELSFATNNSGNMVLLGYFNPNNTEKVTLNAETTSIALIMLHPWTMDLSVEGKEDAVIQIKKMIEFTSFKSSVESSIKSGNLDPLSTIEIVNEIATIQKKIFARFSEQKNPLHFDIDNSKITIKNEYSSAAYSAAIYDSKNIMVSKNQLVEGIGKIQTLLNFIPTNKYTTTPTVPTTFTTPTANGDYTIIAKSGLSFDGSEENSEARNENFKILVLNTVGIFSSKFKALSRLKASKCAAEIGAFLYNGTAGVVNIKNSFDAYAKNKNSKVLLKDVFFFLKEKNEGIVKLINSCTSHSIEIKASPFKKFFEKLELLNRAESAVNGGAHLVDWIQFDKEIKMCFNKNGSEVNACSLLIGTWKETSHIYCGLDVYLIPAGQSQLSANCKSQIYGFENCDRDDLWIFSNSTSGYNDQGLTKCFASDPQTMPFKYSYNSINKTVSITALNETAVYEILELTKTRMKLKIPGDSYSTIISTFIKK